MMVAQARENGRLEVIEFLDQAVSLGRDVFSRKNISNESIEECVKALKRYQRLLHDYGIHHERSIRAIATSAVREAFNRDAFIDKIDIATGIQVDIIDDNDIARYMYISYFSEKDNYVSVSGRKIIISEASGGSCFIMYLNKGNVEYARTTSFGTLRTFQMIESAGTPDTLQGRIVKKQIQRDIPHIVDRSFLKEADVLIALGGDIKFAARRILKTFDPDVLTPLHVSALAQFTETLLPLTVDQIMTRYNQPSADAKSLKPALLYYLSLAALFKLDTIYTAPINIRTGAFLEMVEGGEWFGYLREQVIRSASAIGKKYNYDQPHAQQVAALSSTLFHALKREYKFETRNEILLAVAAHLHDIGLFINTRSHHKHSMYLIQNSNIFGLTNRETILASLIARYHRKAGPRTTHPEFMALTRAERLTVTKLASILRVADALDRTNDQQLKQIQCSAANGLFIITTNTSTDLSLEQIALKDKGALFEETFGLKVELHQKIP